MAEEFKVLQVKSEQVHTSNSLASPSETKPMTAESGFSNDVEAGSEIPSHRNRTQYRDHRILAVISIICGLSCVGIVSLIYSVKTREMNKKQLDAMSSQKAKEYSRKALRWGVAALVSLVALIILLILTIQLISYLLTFIN